MYSQFSVKELGIGRTTPIKIRLVTDKNRMGYHGIVKKLTEILSQKVGRKEFAKAINNQQNNHTKATKENRYRVSESGSRAASVKAKRVLSQKYPNIVKDRKVGSQPDKYFTEFFQLFSSGQVQPYQHVQNFTPYRKQDSYKGKKSYQISSQTITSRKSSARLIKPPDQQKPLNQGISKWQTLQQSLGNSFINQL